MTDASFSFERRTAFRINAKPKYHFHSNYRCFAAAEGLVTLRDFVNMLFTQATERNLLFSLLTWSRDMQLLYNHTLMSEKDTFKLILFMFGNCCPQNYISAISMTEQH